MSVPEGTSLSELPLDELLRYGRELGLDLPEAPPHGELLRRVRERQELLLELDRDAMLDICVWARRPVRRSASKEQLAVQIAATRRMDFGGLSHRGLYCLCRLRGVEARPDDPDDVLRQKLRSAERLIDRLRRHRRTMLGSVLSRWLTGSTRDDDRSEYRFLPERGDVHASLKDEIVDHGVVGGLAGKLRGAADEYVSQKLDEIERRIDRKLDEIDARLCEWRDREISNRLRIVRITLIASVIVAALSLLYKYASVHWLE